MLLHVSEKITAESLAQGDVQPVKGVHGDCGMCAEAKMRFVSSSWWGA